MFIVIAIIVIIGVIKILNTESDTWYIVNDDPHLCKNLNIQSFDKAKRPDIISLPGSQV